MFHRKNIEIETLSYWTEIIQAELENCYIWKLNMIK